MKPLAIITALLLLVASGSAIDCATILNTPTSETEHWRAATYDKFLDSEYENEEWLTRTTNWEPITTLDAGQQYQIRIDNQCFDNALPSRGRVTGATSQDITIEQNNNDLRSNPSKNDRYTISVQEYSPDNQLIGTPALPELVQLPTSVTKTLLEPLAADCDAGDQARNAMERIRDATWKALEPGSRASCSGPNIAHCILQGTASPSEYATIIALTGRACNIPTRVVHGVGSASFDGVDLQLKSDQTTWWVEYYANGWHTLETDETRSTPYHEYNCLDREDNDNDGETDCNDEDCSETAACNYEPATWGSWDNPYSTNPEAITNHQYVNEIILGNTHGELKLQDVDLSGVDLEAAVQITSGRLDTTINHEGYAKLYGLNPREPLILKDGEECAACTVKYYRSDIVGFTTPGAGSYTVIDATAEPTNETVTATPPAAEEGFDLKAQLAKLKDWFLELSTPLKILLFAIIAFAVYQLTKKKEVPPWRYSR